MHQTVIRNLIANVEGGVAKVEALGAGDTSSAAKELRASWAALVENLAVGPAPKTRACPSCKKLIMHDATRCIHCWEKSPPPAE
jgi:hypothetical protein